MPVIDVNGERGCLFSVNGGAPGSTSWNSGTSRVRCS